MKSTRSGSAHDDGMQTAARRRAHHFTPPARRASLNGRRDAPGARVRWQSRLPEKVSGNGEFTQAALAELIRQHAFRISQLDDPVDALAQVIKLVIGSDADPYHLIGVLAEGAVETISQRIPAAQRRDTAMALLQFMLDRMQPERAH
jgi:hypothetical protein